MAMCLCYMVWVSIHRNLYAISAYHHWCCEFESRSGRGVQYFVIVCQWLATGRWFSPGPSVSFTNKTDNLFNLIFAIKVDGYIYTLENIEGAIENGQSRETGNIGYTRRRQTKQKHNTICVRYHYTQTNTNNVNKTWALLQTTGGKDESQLPSSISLYIANHFYFFVVLLCALRSEFPVVMSVTISA
jgi:hypothetical protein